MKDETRTQVYDTLAEIAFRTGATADEMLEAIEWFKDKFFKEEAENEVQN